MDFLFIQGFFSLNLFLPADCIRKSVSFAKFSQATPYSMEKINKLRHTRDTLEQQAITCNSYGVMWNNFRKQKINVLAIYWDILFKLVLPVQAVLILDMELCRPQNALDYTSLANTIVKIIPCSLYAFHCSKAGHNSLSVCFCFERGVLKERKS